MANLQPGGIPMPCYCPPGIDLKIAVDGQAVEGVVSFLSPRDIGVRIWKPFMTPQIMGAHIPLLGDPIPADRLYAVEDESGALRLSDRGERVANKLLERQFRATREARARADRLLELLEQARAEVAVTTNDLGLSPAEVSQAREQLRAELKSGGLDKETHERRRQELRRLKDMHSAFEQQVKVLVATRLKEHLPPDVDARDVERAWRDFGGAERPWLLPPGSKLAYSTPRTLAIGDPQAPEDMVEKLLERHAALDVDRHVLPGVTLLSVGDHFDYEGRGCERDFWEYGLVLNMLADLPRERCALLLGDHDLARVAELAGVVGDAFVEARREAQSLAWARRAFLATPATRKEEAAADLNRRRMEFAERYPWLPSPYLADQGWKTFSEGQRGHVQKLLLDRRFALAAVATMLDGTKALATHAGVTQRELGLLGCPESRDPMEIATRLNRFLAERVEAVAARWRAGEPAPLDLSPLSIPGVGGPTAIYDDSTHPELVGFGIEGGGLLHHRPSKPNNNVDIDWAWDSGRPRYFDPRLLPRGLVQVVGHTTNWELLAELGDWVRGEDFLKLETGLRVLQTDGTAVRLLPWEEVGSYAGDVASMVFIDVGLAQLDLSRVSSRFMALPLQGVEVPW